jgi:hypothetical protein
MMVGKTYDRLFNIPATIVVGCTADDTKQVPLPLPDLLVDLALYRSLYHLLCMVDFNCRLVFFHGPTVHS